MTRAARPRTSSAGSGFFLFGMIDEPVENASLTRTNPNRGFDHQVISSASRLRCTIPSAMAPSVSTTKSRSLTASSELAVTPSKPSSAAVASPVERVAGTGESARRPSGETFARRRASLNRARSRSAIST